MTFDRIIVMACENYPQTTTTTSTTTEYPASTTSTTTEYPASTTSTTTEEPVTTTTTSTEELPDLFEHASAQVDARISGEDPVVAEPVFSIRDHVTPEYVRNVNGWGYAVDLTPISPWNSGNVDVSSGILISPCHVLFATHTAVGPTGVLRFITQDNVVVERTVSTFQSLGSDITICRLDSDVPGTISFARVLPVNWADYFSGGSPAGLPVAYTDQEEKLLVADLKEIDQLFLAFHLTTLDEPTDPTRNSFFETLVGGDSGNPMCLVIENKLVVLAAFKNGANPPDWSAGAGDSLSYYYADINAAMTALGGGYQLTDVDLSGFRTY